MSITAADLVRVLSGVKGSGPWTAQCPAHDDNGHHLTFEERGGKVLWHCHHGCPQAKVTDAIHEKLGTARGENGSGAPVATYTYTNESGAPLFYRERFEWMEQGKVTKKVYPRQLNGARKGKTPVPYRLHELKHAIADDATVLLVEGEKCADALHANGYVATTTGSASSWHRKFAPHFRGARVVLWPDNDAEGETYIANAAQDLIGIAAEIRVLRFDGKPAKWDAADYFAEGGTEGQLDQLLADAPTWNTMIASLSSEPPADDAPKSRQRFTLWTVDDLAQIPETQPLVEGLLSRDSLVAIIAKFASFKSFLALDLALCIATGLDWHGRAVSQGLVLYIYVEGVRSIRRRVEAWRLLNQLPDVGGIYFLPQSVILNDPRDCRELLLAIETMPSPPAAIFVDTLARTLSGNESATEDMNAYIDACTRIREATRAAVVLVHHVGWEGTRSRGSTSLPGALDTEITLVRDDDQVGVDLTKQKDGPEGPVMRLQAVHIGDSLALKPVVPTSSLLTKNERIALNAVQISNGVASTLWRESTGLAKGSFENARKRLLALAYVRVEKKNYVATEAGRMAAGTKDKAGTSEGQRGGSLEGQPHPTSLEVGVCP